MPLGGAMTQLGPTFTTGGDNASYQSGLQSATGNMILQARYGAASLYRIDTLADVAYPADLLPPAAVRRDWYVNPPRAAMPTTARPPPRPGPAWTRSTPNLPPSA